MNLANLQAKFQTILLHSECHGPDWIEDSVQGLSTERRMAVYYNAYRIRLIDTLIDSFEHTFEYLGEQWFNQLAAGYVQSNISTHNNIALYGQYFPEYLADHLAEDQEVSELASLDWALRRAFDGANAEVVSQQDLQVMMSGGDDIEKLAAVPTLRILKFYFNTLEIWHAIDQEKTPPKEIRLAEPVNVMIWRKGYSPHFRSIDSIESAAISYFSNGYSFDAIGEALAADYPEVDIVKKFGTLLARWLTDELLTVNPARIDKRRLTTR